MRVERLTPTIVEVVVRAPAAARRFRPGQFYRLQNYETLAPLRRRHAARRWKASRSPARGSTASRASSRRSCWRWAARPTCARCCSRASRSILMGPTGTPTEIEPGETVVLVGGGLGNAVLFSIGQAFRDAGSKVLYFAGYKKMIDRYKVAEIEAAADVVVWCCDEAPGLRADAAAGPRVRRQHRARRCARTRRAALGAQPIPFADVRPASSRSAPTG